ncbi:MAG TPA: hypothetical protein DFR83_24500 [Deltaproteobacteria bacterium]|nr:hypothetical protein [Deltaproteobacteria bacterium]
MRGGAKTARRKERVRALRTELEQRRLRAREQLERRRRSVGERKKSPHRWWLLGVILLFLLLLVDCEAEPPQPLPEPPSIGAATVETGTSSPTTPTFPGGRVPTSARPSMPVPEPDALPWLASFEMQVAARSPRLAACFEGTRRPGALRWTARVEATTGVVSDHVLEPVLQTEALSARLRGCLVDVLSAPPYVLRQPDQRSTPPRVRLVIEF